MKVKTVFYSMYGHIYRMAEAIAAGAREVEGAEVELLQIPELVPDAVLEGSGAKKARAVFALEDTPPNLAAGKDAKPDLHLVHPGGRGWGKMQVIPTAM